MMDKADAAVQAMDRSIRHDIREVLFAIWAERVGVDWGALTDDERAHVMGRMAWSWSRAL